VPQGQKTNQVLIPEARMALDQFKYEVAADLGINPPGNYWGNLTSRDCGAVGGHMVRRMIHLAEQNLAGRTPPR